MTKSTGRAEERAEERNDAPDRDHRPGHERADAVIPDNGEDPDTIGHDAAAARQAS
jgi:hypothetical protein